LLAKLDEARDKGGEVDIKAVLKALSFNVAGQLLHRLFWDNMSPKGGGKPASDLLKKIEKEFGSFKRFKDEFSQAAKSVEGSGWAALAKSKETGRLLIMQIEKHNLNIIPEYKLLLVIDVWEHAYYLDYENNRGAFIEAFWKVVNWDAVSKRLL
jgi:Fe-Mn family superoxide dismutase